MTARPRIYLDHAATTPILPAAKAAMVEAMERWANPSSPHAEGRAARAALEDARERIKTALGWTGEMIFTSGATEAISLGLSRARCDRRLMSPVEHDAVVRAAPDAAMLPLDHNGELDLHALKKALRGRGRPLLALQHVNSETGQVQRLDDAIAVVRGAGGLVFSDAAQSAGRMPLPDADLIAVSAHKLGGPPGIGALLVKDLAILEATGGQERGYRGGTENVLGAVGFAAALEHPRSGASESALFDATCRLVETMSDLGGNQVFGGRGVEQSQSESGHIMALSMPGLSAATQLVRFDLAGFAVSAGSACSSGSMKPSRVLAAFGVDPDEAARTIRISFGWDTTPEDIAAFGQAWLRIAEDGRKRAA
jgi:cysteine desulfurase